MAVRKAAPAAESPTGENKTAASGTAKTGTAARQPAAKQSQSQAQSPAPAQTDSQAPGRRLLHWARAAGIFGDVAAPGPGAEHGEVLDAVGRSISLRQLGSLVKARAAEQLIESRSGTELGSLIRALEKLPAWARDGGVAEEADEAEEDTAWPANLSFEEVIAETKRLLGEIEASGANG